MESIDLFKERVTDISKPLAERCRPANINEIYGHHKFLAKDSAFRKQVENKQIPSMILWGPPGVGKTTLARVIIELTGFESAAVSAVSSGKREVNEIIRKAKHIRKISANRLILFIDEIHRFNKAQQDALLHAIEDGTIILIGATTENPSFEVIAPLLSRCQVLKLENLSKKDIEKIINRAIKTDPVLSGKNIRLTAMDQLISISGGDARISLNLLEICFNIADKDNDIIEIDAGLIKNAAESNAMLYDKKGDYHYDTISALIKSVRGSDPDAAVVYLAKMLESGEDPMFIIRRLIILASEDVGNAEPYALSLTTSAMTAIHNVGMPEAAIILAQVTTYLAACPKSNAAYMALSEATADVQNKPEFNIPLHLRNATTALMRKLKYGKGYKYPHTYDEHFVMEDYFPEGFKNKNYYKPTDIGREKILKDRLHKLWNKRYK